MYTIVCVDTLSSFCTAACLFILGILSSGTLDSNGTATLEYCVSVCVCAGDWKELRDIILCNLLFLAQRFNTILSTHQPNGKQFIFLFSIKEITIVTFYSLIILFALAISVRELHTNNTIAFNVFTLPYH